MSDIHENLEKIKNAVWGKDVRQAIHDSIHDCYEDGKAGGTDLIAREMITAVEKMKADKVDLAEEVSTRSREIAVERSRVDNLVAKLGSDEVRKTLWTGSAKLENTTFEIDGVLSDYDYLDIALNLGGKTQIQTVYVTEGEKVLRSFNIPNDPVTGKYVTASEITLTLDITNNVLMLRDHLWFSWNYASQSVPTLVKVDDESIGSATIYQIDGRKIVENVETSDIRIGADGTVYDTAGEAVRTQITDLKEDLTEATGYKRITIQPTDSEPYAGYWFYNANAKTITLAPVTTYYTLEHPTDISGLAAGNKVSVLSSLSSIYGVYIADETFHVLDFVNGNNAVEKGYEVSADLQLVTMVVPKNAKYIVSHIRTTKYTGISDFNVFGFAKLYVDELETRVDSLETEVDAIEASNGLETYTITPTFTDGHYVTIKNEVAESQTYSYTEYIDVKPFKTITVAYYFSGSGASMVFLSEDRNTVIEAYRRADLADAPVTLTVPNGACWFRSSQNTAHKSEFAFSGTMHYIEKVYDMSSATVPTEEQPLDHIIHDGGFCKIFDKIGVVGDSLASGSIAKPSSESHSESDEEIVDLIWYSWIQQISRYTGSTAFNFSMGGLAARGLRFGTSNPNVQVILDNLENNDKKCKMYYVALGHNDYNYMVAHPGEYPMGTIADCNLSDPEQNANSYYGNYAWVISKIKSVQPRAKIFLITMKNGTVYGEFNTAIRDMVGLFNTYYANTDVYLIDMEGVPIETSWEYYEGHGSPQGYLNYSYQISSYVDFIIRHNQSDFKTVPYIGTSYLT